MAKNEINNEEIDKIERKESRVVALKYEKGYKAPRVVAKGSGFVAEKILEIAEKSNIKIHEDAQLNENLNKLSLGEDIPRELFEVVAKIYAFIDQIDSLVEKSNISDNS